MTSRMTSCTADHVFKILRRGHQSATAFAVAVFTSNSFSAATLKRSQSTFLPTFMEIV